MRKLAGKITLTDKRHYPAESGTRSDTAECATDCHTLRYDGTELAYITEAADGAGCITHTLAEFPADDLPYLPDPWLIAAVCAMARRQSWPADRIKTVLNGMLTEKDTGRELRERQSLIVERQNAMQAEITRHRVDQKLLKDYQTRQQELIAELAEYHAGDAAD